MPIDSSEVRALANENRLHPHPRYHGNAHQVRWRDIRTALSFCFRLELDTRHHREPSMWPRYVAWGHFSARRTMRVDFELQNEGREFIVVVTAFEVTG